MIYWILSAWFMGLIGSTHCIGMCGPLAMALPVNTTSKWEKLFLALTYNLGRVTTYTLLGAGIGAGSALVIPSALQSSFSISIGILMLLSAFVIFVLQRKKAIQILPDKWIKKVSHLIATRMQSGRKIDVFIIGFLNGLLPCALVYAALVTAFASGSVVNSMVFMMFFGLNPQWDSTIALCFSSSMLLGEEFRDSIRTRTLYLAAIALTNELRNTPSIYALGYTGA